ncbi:MAG: DinB family protein [Candidatus Limnocylindrales bacterium]
MAVGTTWLGALESAAPDLVAAFQALDEGRYLAVRREVRRHAGEGTAIAAAAQLGAVAAHLDKLIATFPPALLAAPGGEEDWNVAQALGHTIAARQGLVLAAQLAAADRWPEGVPTVVPGVPGRPDADGSSLRERLARSQRFIERAAVRIAGHELTPCPLDHPLVGRLRCGEWLLFAGVHDLMHVEQVEGLLAGARRPAAIAHAGAG